MIITVDGRAEVSSEAPRKSRSHAMARHGGTREKVLLDSDLSAQIEICSTPKTNLQRRGAADGKHDGQASRVLEPEHAARGI
jgi:hypothetical protein